MNKSDKEFIKHYLVTALWSSTGNNDQPLDDDYGTEGIDFNSIKRAVKDCLLFIKACEKKELLLNYEYSTAGHDFWLTRNGHGAGFWDGDYPGHGDALTDLSHNFREINCTEYDGKIEIY